VRREDDPGGKWNYEGVVKTNGKEWGFEVDPKGKFFEEAHRDQKIIGKLEAEPLPPLNKSDPG
jgi:hypothetical protein